MISRSGNNNGGITLEEKFANVTSQLSSAIERLDHAEHDLDLERTCREDIINAEVERRLKEREAALKAEYEEKNRWLEQEKKEHEELLRKKMEKHEEDLQTSFANMTQSVIAQAKEQIAQARRKAEDNSLSRMARHLELFAKSFIEIISGNSTEGQALLKQYQEAAKEAEAALKEELKEAYENAEKKAGKKAYLYCRNYEAVDRACIMYSMFGACKVHGKNPAQWLTHMLKHIDTTTNEDLHKLLPEEWETT